MEEKAKVSNNSPLVEKIHGFGHHRFRIYRLVVKKYNQCGISMCTERLTIPIDQSCLEDPPKTISLDLHKEEGNPKSVVCKTTHRL